MVETSRPGTRAAVAAMVQRDHGDAECAGDVRRPGVHTYIEIELRHQRRGRAQTELAGDGHCPAGSTSMDLRASH